MLQASTLQFLKSLNKNNNKIWLDKNRQKYLDAKEDFEMFVNQIFQRLVLFDSDLVELDPKRSIFRLNRDIRFSKDKTPYKTFFSASFKKGEKKSIYAGYYFQVEPGDKTLLVGGLWNPLPPELKKVRQEIDYCLPEFKKILHSPAFKKIYDRLDYDKRQFLINVPKGYEKQNPAAEFLKLKSFVASAPLADNALLHAKAEDKIADEFKAISPLIKFLNRALD